MQIFYFIIFGSSGFCVLLVKMKLSNSLLTARLLAPTKLQLRGFLKAGIT